MSSVVLNADLVSVVLKPDLVSVVGPYVNALQVAGFTPPCPG
jgi:hypothetical protein